MNIVETEILPPNLLERLVSFEASFQGKDWEEMYQCYEFLKQKKPNNIFRAAPYVYIDIINKNFGYIFIDTHNEVMFYVYK